MIDEEKQELLSWTNSIIDNLLKYPAMFGSYQSVELQYLLLLEFIEKINGSSTNVLDNYHKFRFGKFKKSLYLFDLLQENFITEQQFIDSLLEFKEKV